MAQKSRRATAFLATFLAAACGQGRKASQGGASGSGQKTTSPASPNPSPSDGPDASDGGCANLSGPTRQVFPKDYAINIDVSSLPADAAQTAAYLGAGSYYGGASLHPDFGTNFGIPYNFVRSTELAAADIKTIKFEEAEESDPGPYPLPAGLLQESGPFDSDPAADHHILVVDTDTCKIYETYQVNLSSAPLSGYGGAIFDAAKTPARPVGWTSSDAAGLAIFPLLVKYDEVAAGAVHHAFRFTFQHTADRYVYPATHKAGLSDTKLPPMGLLIRLKQSVSLAGLGPQATIIAAALKAYGMYAADNGGSGFFQGEPNAKWDDDDLNGLKRLKLADFEVVVPPQP